MRRRKVIKSLLFFTLVTMLPVLKVFLLGAFEAGEQEKYIRIYFWLQFLVPIVDLGYYWSLVRGYVTSGCIERNVNKLSIVGFFAALALFPYNTLYAQLLLLASVTAWYNFNLQVFRIQGKTGIFYKMRMSKVVIDISLLVVLYVVNKLSVELLLITELLSVVLVMSVLMYKEGVRGNILTFSTHRTFSFDYLYMILNVVRSNFIRLLIPIIFLNQGLERLLFALLFYELVAQYISIEKLKDLLAGKINVLLYTVLYISSIPFQILAIFSLGKIMAWNFGMLEIFCIILGGSARIFSIYTLNVVKNNAFNLLVCMNVFFVVLGAASVYLFQQFYNGASLAQLVLLTFYAAEAIVGLSLVVFLERSNFMKRV